MCAACEHIDLGFTQEHFPAGTHMCLIFNDEEERKEIVARFIESGLKTGEKVGYFTDEPALDTVRTWLQQKGIEAPILENADQFCLNSTESTYCPNGEFVPDEMIDTLKSFYNTAREDKYYAARVSGEMWWALKGIPGSEKLMEYESRVNTVVKEYPVTAICQYDANKFDGATILECLKVHPFMIVHGQIIRNPYYLSTEEYLKI